jgi:hypothetical protein
MNASIPEVKFALVRIKKGVKPYGGRLFKAMVSMDGWLVDVKSCKSTIYKMENFTYKFGKNTAWRNYKISEVEVIKG